MAPVGRDSAGDRARKTTRGEKERKERKWRDRSVRKGGRQLRVFFRVVVTINPISSVITSTNAG